MSSHLSLHISSKVGKHFWLVFHYLSQLGSKVIFQFVRPFRPAWLSLRHLSSLRVCKSLFGSARSYLHLQSPIVISNVSVKKTWANIRWWALAAVWHITLFKVTPLDENRLVSCMYLQNLFQITGSLYKKFQEKLHSIEINVEKRIRHPHHYLWLILDI